MAEHNRMMQLTDSSKKLTWTIGYLVAGAIISLVGLAMAYMYIENDIYRYIAYGACGLVALIGFAGVVYNFSDFMQLQKIKSDFSSPRNTYYKMTGKELPTLDTSWKNQ